MKGALGNLMQQAQQMQQRMQQVQEELAALEVTGMAGGGMVKVTLNGRLDARRVEIDPSAYTDDREMLEDLIVAAINDATRKLESTRQEKMGELTGGLNLPPGFNLNL